MTIRRSISTLTLLLLLALSATVVAAQNIRFEWDRWDTIITVQDQRAELEIAETQTFDIQAGTVRFGTRSWTDPVEIESLYFVDADGQPVPLNRVNSDQPGSYTLTESGGETTLQYNFPTTMGPGDEFTIQINYTTPITLDQVVDWIVIPGEHAFTVNNSSVTINFPDSEAPAAELVRVVSGTGSVQRSDNVVRIESQGPIAANQTFEIQMPFGAGVGVAAGGSDAQSEPAPEQPPLAPQPQPEPGLGISLSPALILVILCVVGFLILGGGSKLLRTLLGGLLAGGLRPGGNRSYPGGGREIPYNPTNPRVPRTPRQPSSPRRGFRPSANQNRDVPQIKKRKDSGGSAGLGS